jgi:hypothetical protein
LGDRGGRERADELAHNLSVAEGLDGRDPLDLVAERQLGVGKPRNAKASLTSGDLFRAR